MLNVNICRIDASQHVRPAGGRDEEGYSGVNRMYPAPIELDSNTLTRLNLFVKFYKTKMCPFYKKKRCEWGPDCKFAHGRKELRSGPDLSKTRMCPSLQRRGRCEQGAACRFAHHHEELRATSDIYKTSLGYPWMLPESHSAMAMRRDNGAAQQVNAMERRPASLRNATTLPVGTMAPIHDAAGPSTAICSLPESRQFGASMPVARLTENDEVEFCFRFLVPRGAVVGLKGAQPKMVDATPACDGNGAGHRHSDTGIDPAFLKAAMSFSPEVPRLVPDYPSREAAEFQAPAASLPHHASNNPSATRLPPAQRQPELLPAELLPKFLSAGLDEDLPSSDRETASPSSGASSSDFLRDFCPYTPLSGPASDYDLRFLPATASPW
ncbi:zinc finger (CCCH type) motif-containing protein [Besnoitia besnoiti]|uniref:Zinc finger (CCCH type) motif-containing protein n=1 Tax=Besnoitia besnoiti TaxID=94643 RepID=A0A2A9MCN6_BESBE|nr:zinc finger (CCCH type) motif-containing protein [Besnoitia besnoiti]PFH33160.1 zinc finger (CCCH type) motif-containing protein [Besnoitia besnoiti]